MALARSELSGNSLLGARAHTLGWSGRARLAGEIVLAYVTTRRALARAPITYVVDDLREQPRRMTSPAAEDALAEARHLGNAVTRTLALIPGDTRCLARSLVLAHLLARRGIPATLVIGARTAPSFLAHAWVEHDGRAVLSPGDGSFDRLIEL